MYTDKNIRSDNFCLFDSLYKLQVYQTVKSNQTEKSIHQCVRNQITFHESACSKRLLPRDKTQ